MYTRVRARSLNGSVKAALRPLPKGFDKRVDDHQGSFSAVTELGTPEIVIVGLINLQ